MTPKPPSQAAQRPVAARPALGKGKALLLAERAAKGLGARRPKPHPLIVGEANRHGGRMLPRVHDHTDIPLSRPVGSGGGVNTNLPGAKLPPATWHNWLHGVGQLLTPTPAMVDIGTNYLIHATTINDQAQATWTRIHKRKSTI